MHPPTRSYEGLYRLLTEMPKVKPERVGKTILLDKGAPGAPEQALSPRLEIPERGRRGCN